jgi:hypothetical protein
MGSEFVVEQIRTYRFGFGTVKAWEPIERDPQPLRRPPNPRLPETEWR